MPREDDRFRKPWPRRDRPGPGGGRERHARRMEPPDHVVLYGFHPVAEALGNPRRKPLKLLATENAARRLAEALGGLPIDPEIVLPKAIAQRLTPDAVHQGLLLEAEPLPAPALDALGSHALVVVLDQITDPHNVGAILRTAAAFAVDAVITTERHSPEATGVLAKSASGALEHVPIISVRNLGDTLESLGRQGVLRIGLDSEGTVGLAEAPLAAPMALVLGAEGRGLRQRTRSLCDVLARLDMPGAIKSLNVSNAAAVALHIADRALRRPAAPAPGAPSP